MGAHENTLGQLLELGNLTERRTRAGQLEQALRTAVALTDADAAVAMTPSGRRAERLVMHAGSGAPALLPPSTQPSEVLKSLGENGEPLLVADLSEDARLAGADGCPGVQAGPVMFIAVRQRDPAPGYLAVYRRRGRAKFGVNDSRTMLLLAAWLGMALESLRLASGAEKLSLTDDLTEVYNARFLRSALKRELRRAGRFGQELSLVLADVDNLETWNEEHGELRGSALIKEVATLLAQQVRSFDLMARYRGDAFMLILPQTGRGGALEVAERMRAMVERHAFGPAPAGAVTVSLGVASFPQEGAEPAALIASVERALAQAQQRGMNCVESLARRAA